MGERKERGSSIDELKGEGMTKSKVEAPWVSAYDSELKRWVSWDDMQSTWYREHQARRCFVSANHPFIWVMQSNWLHLSAVSLWQATDEVGRYSAFERQNVALMLAGMSLECGIKSRMIALCEYSLNPSNQKRIFSGNHDLAALALSARVRTNASDRAILKSLSVYIRWLGRYPTPRSADEMVRHWMDTRLKVDEIWNGYNLARERIGRSVSQAIRKWSAVSR